MSGRVSSIAEFHRAFSRMREIALMLGALFCILGAPSALADEKQTAAANTACTNRIQVTTRYLICRFDPETADIRLFLNDDDGAPFSHFGNLRASWRPRANGWSSL